MVGMLFFSFVQQKTTRYRTTQLIILNYFIIFYTSCMNNFFWDINIDDYIRKRSCFNVWFTYSKSENKRNKTGSVPFFTDGATEEGGILSISFLESLWADMS